MPIARNRFRTEISSQLENRVMLAGDALAGTASLGLNQVVPNQEIPSSLELFFNLRSRRPSVPEESGENREGSRGTAIGRTRLLRAGLDHYEGLTVAEGRALAGSEGLRFRVTRVDGRGQMVTMDVRFDRVSVEVNDGIITDAELH